jgi:xanthosine utilization system XapX-like protein
MSSRALIGAAFAAFGLYLAGVLVLGTPPPAAATGEQVVSWFREHRDGVRWFVWANTVGAPLVAVMFALLRRLLPAPHRDVFLIGAIGIVTTAAVQSWIWGGLALHADRLEPATARTVLDVALFWGPVLTGATTTMMAPVTWLALLGDAGLPRWLGILGAVAFAEQAVETVTIFGSTGFTEPGGAMNLELGAALVWIWILAFAVWGGIRGTCAEANRSRPGPSHGEEV